MLSKSVLPIHVLILVAKGQLIHANNREVTYITIRVVLLYRYSKMTAWYSHINFEQRTNIQLWQLRFIHLVSCMHTGIGAVFERVKRGDDVGKERERACLAVSCLFAYCT